MDDIHIWSTSLNITEIEQYKNCPPTGNENGLSVYWNFEEGTGTTIQDLTSNNNSGTLNNGVNWSTEIVDHNCSATGIEGNIVTNEIKIYPNPTKSSITIDNNSTISGYFINIENTLGQVIYSNQLNQFQQTINIDKWYTGIYFINIFDSAGRKIENSKIVKE